MRRGRAALASLLVGAVLFLDALAACPALHKRIHPDADQHGHECAVTMFADGKLESAAVDTPLPLPTVSTETELRIEFSFFGAAIETLPHSRAPPFLLGVS